VDPGKHTNKVEVRNCIEAPKSQDRTEVMLAAAIPPLDGPWSKGVTHNEHHPGLHRLKVRVQVPKFLCRVAHE